MTSDRYKKGTAVKLSEHFNSKEFDCPCEGCSHTLVEQRLIELLESTRRLLAVPILISHGGGYRCDNYQFDLKRRGYETSLGISTHQLGKAVDISTGHHSGAEIECLARQAGFRAVGVGSNWCHLDTRGDKDRFWSYAKR